MNLDVLTIARTSLFGITTLTGSGTAIFDRDDRFFHHRHFFFGFDFASFWLPLVVPLSLPYYYGYPYDYSYNDYGPSYDYQYWNDLAVSVQSELVRRGYYQGAIDGVIGSGSREAIRAFQAAQGLPVTGVIAPKLLKALGFAPQSTPQLFADVQALARATHREVKLPPGYHLEFGGQFKNLQDARSRLLFVVPLALFLIFFLLFSAF